ncbi:monovalent cation/H(+) antiporter subunit G [Roseococcus sp. YIM B11640]|uniref:monovalent cation/H(+) antiporter subunit G n=1 Tax=Roseococcus sp. YIM B11640 TaxID=3133973 RepID=UPI003C7D2C8C
MSAAPDLPLWAAIVVAVLLLLGAGITLVGSFGLLRLRTFYERVHAPTLGTSAGIFCVLAASMVCFTVLQTRLVIHEIVIGVFVLVTTPVTLMLLSRASLYRDRQEGSEDVPARREDPAPP